jgi:hypothetical protein
MIEVVACPAQVGSVDIRDSRYPDDEVLHASAAHWAEFLVTAKAGAYDVTGKPGLQAGSPAS